jgi:hypothetical protein
MADWITKICMLLFILNKEIKNQLISSFFGNWKMHEYPQRNDYNRAENIKEVYNKFFIILF